MQMMKCPHCGAENSSRRDYCYQCDGELRGEPKARPADGAAICSACAHAAVFPPPGQRLRPDQVWCTQKGETVASARIADSCFSQAFGWHREDILD